MKKQRKQLIILLVVLAVLAACFLGLQQYNKIQSETPQEEEGITIVNLDRDEIVKFSYDYEGETYQFEKEGDTWYYAEDHSLNLNQNTITAKVAKVSPLEAEQVIENVTDLTQYGLDEPSKVVTFETATESVILYMGDYNSVTQVYYVCKPSETTVYTVEAHNVTAFNYALEDLIEEEEETEETATEEAAAEETATEEAAAEETATEEAAAGETVTEETASEESATEETVTLEAATEEAASE